MLISIIGSGRIEGGLKLQRPTAETAAQRKKAAEYQF